LNYVDGCTNILIKVITMVFELVTSQIQLKFAVCNSNTRKMKSISGWKDEDSVVKKNLSDLFVRRKAWFHLSILEVKIFLTKRIFELFELNLYYLICLSNNHFVLGHESCDKSWDFYKFLELSHFYFVVLSLLENIHID